MARKLWPYDSETLAELRRYEERFSDRDEPEDIDPECPAWQDDPAEGGGVDGIPF